jgi:hypothetical protein
MTYFGFAVADGMFPSACTVTRQPLAAGEAASIIRLGIIPCLNPSHAATIAAMRERYGVDVEIPATAPKVALEAGDALIVMSVRGLPRLDASRHEYTPDEIAGADFAFGLWSVKA